MLRSLIDQLHTAAADAGTRQVLMVAVDALDGDPDQPRKTFDNLEEFTASIRAIGVQQPLLVRQDPKDAERFIVIAGERRLKCAHRAGLAAVPCLLETGDEAKDPGRVLISQLTENLQRSDMPILETARALEQALQLTGLNKAALAAMLGKQRSFVSKHLALLKTAGPTRDALEEGLLKSSETSRLFAALPETRQRNLLREARLSGQPIARGQVETGGPQASKATGKSGKEGAKAHRPRSKTSDASFRLRLRADQIRRIIHRFDEEPPNEPSELKPTLLKLLR